MTSRSDLFAGFTCWNAQDVHHVIHADAASPDDAVFLATHQPMTIIQRPLRGDMESRYVNEEELLAQFMKPDVTMMLLPIIGGSGTGKSHLVRWLQARIGTSDPSRRVVYVPKIGTSLRKVIELILDGMEGDQADALRESLREATERLDEKTAPSAVLNALADRVQHTTLASTNDLERDELRRRITKLIPDLLRDPFFRNRHFLREGSVVHGFVERAINGHRPGDGESAFEFTAKQLQEVTFLPPNDASRPAREAQDLLRTQHVASEAAEILTANLGPAIQSVFGLEGSVSLTDVMTQTRRTLAERGTELVLLIEDFTMLQGIQRELLDALVEPPVRKDQPRLCGIRVTLAVTSGYWDSLEDTVRTRAAFASHIYDLNVPVSDGASSQADIPRFFSRYLNAARLGVTPLKSAVSASTSGEWVPNACESCMHQLECHDAFGEAEGFGLYPFNELAIRRTTDAVTESHYFDPRAVLGAVLSQTLIDYHDAIQMGNFPNADYEANYTNSHREQKALPADVKLDLQRYVDPQRRQALLTIWGGCPPEVVDLAPGIHRAFQVPPMGTPLQTLPPTANESQIRPDPAPSANQGALQAQLDKLDKWAEEGGVLIDEVMARKLRQSLVDALWESMDLNVSLLSLSKEEKETFLSQASFHIEGASGGQTPGRRMWSTHIKRGPASAAMFKGILQFRESGAWSFRRGAQALRTRLNNLDKWAADFSQHIELELRQTQLDTEQEFRHLVRDAALLGCEEAASHSWLEVLNSAFVLDHPDPITRQDHLGSEARESFKTRPERIRKFLSTRTAYKPNTRQSAYAIDTSAFLQVAKNIADVGLGPDSADLQLPIKKEMDGLVEVAGQIKLLCAGNTENATIVGSLLLTLEDAAGLGVGDQSVSALKLEARHWSDFDMSLVHSALEVQPEKPPLDIRPLLSWIATQPGKELKDFATFLERAVACLEGVSQGINLRIKSANQDMGTSELEATLVELLALLTRAES